MAKYTVQTIEDFSGGENLSVTPDLLAPNEARELQNMDPILQGGVVSRWGTALDISPSGTEGTRIIEFEYYTGSTRVTKRLMLRDSELIEMTTNTVIKTGLADHMAYEVLDNKIYILSNGLFFYYNGIGTADVTTTDIPEANLLAEVKKCKYLHQRGDRLFASGNPDHPNELYYSQPFSPSDWWTPAKMSVANDPMGINPIRAVSDDGDIVTGLAQLHGALLVFKTRHIYAWFGFDPMTQVQFKQLDVESGTISHRTIVKVDNALLYLGHNGVYALRGTVEHVIATEYLSENVSAYIKRMTRLTNYHNTKISAVFVDGRYLVSIPVDGETDCSIILALHTKIMSAIGKPSWSHYTGLAFNDMLVGYDGRLLALRANSTDVIHMADEHLSDEGGLIQAKIRLRPIFVEGSQAFYTKKFRSIFIIAKQFEGVSSRFIIGGNIDYTPLLPIQATTNTALVWDFNEWDGAVWDFSEVEITGGRLKARGKRLDLEFYMEEVDNKLLIYKLGVEFKYKKLEKVRSSADGIN